MSKRLQAEKVDPSPLSKPLHFEFADRTAPNRFLKAAMTERISSWDPKDFKKRGIPSKNLINVYRRWGEGALGLILTGNIMVEYDHIEAPGNPIVPQDAPADPSDDRFQAFKEMASAAKAHGSLFVAQISHPGRQVESRIQKNPVSASDIQLEGTVMGMQFGKPHAASQQEIDHIIAGFTHAATYLHAAGYDGIQLHGAHGYLLAQFLSSSTNKRTDKYGGSLKNRARLILEIAQSIRRKLPAKESGFVIGIKINSVEFQEGGFSTDDARQLCELLEQNEFDFVELSGGTYQSLAFSHKKESTKRREAFFLEFADSIAPGLKKTKVYVTGGLRTVKGMVDALKTVDGVGLARPVCQEPYFCKDVLQGKITGVIDQQLDQNNFGLTNVAAGTQMRQVGKDEEPIDLSVKENVDAFNKDMEAWGKAMAEDGEKLEKFGYIDIVSAQAKPYGTVEA